MVLNSMQMTPIQHLKNALKFSHIFLHPPRTTEKYYKVAHRDGLSNVLANFYERLGMHSSIIVFKTPVSLMSDHSLVISPSSICRFSHNGIHAAVAHPQLLMSSKHLLRPVLFSHAGGKLVSAEEALTEALRAEFTTRQALPQAPRHPVLFTCNPGRE